MAFIRLTRRNVAALKRSLLDRFPGVGSAHADEALAAGIGFNTHAALLAALRAQGEAARVAVLVDEGAVVARLRSLEAFAGDELAVSTAFRKTQLDDEGTIWGEVARLMRRQKAANEN